MASVSAPDTVRPAKPPSALRRWLREVGRGLGYQLANFPLALIGFTLTIILFSLGFATTLIWIGFPLLIAGAYTARGFAGVERALLRGLLRREAPTPLYRQLDRRSTRFRRALTPLADPQTWMDALWTLIHFLLMMITLPVALLWALGAAITVLGPVSIMLTRRVIPPTDYHSLGLLLGYKGTAAFITDIAVPGLIGLFFLLTIAPMMRLLSLVHSAVSYGLLCSRHDEQQRLAQTQRSRDAGRAAEAESLRRLERDLHDGPQQGLVRATMDLARAERLAAIDPERSLSIVRDTRARLSETLAELRRLSRGIAPPILIDRGLLAALTELTARSSIPTTVTCPHDRLPAHIETGIYYVASEALANANKHSQARTVTVCVQIDSERAQVRIEDDGVGGAAFSKGHGLVGLTERVAALEGTLRLESPRGGPTALEAVIPIGS
ncbi:sensor histidine kinase [Devriesea agamarum]|uniref:sensor histidine kinase n=1 Tax=Devriesea agamarum TaxID=472569 RepID=UPI00071E22A0|nr:sensor histidine kinase [Devriesea agamarum]